MPSYCVGKFHNKIDNYNEQLSLGYFEYQRSYYMEKA